VAAERQEPGLVALDQRLERPLMPTTNQSDEALVALEAEMRGEPGENRYPRGVSEGGGFQEILETVGRPSERTVSAVREGSKEVPCAHRA
jgi:hypothetical protein